MTPKLLEDERAEDAIAQRIADKSDSETPRALDARPPALVLATDHAERHGISPTDADLLARATAAEEALAPPPAPGRYEIQLWTVRKDTHPYGQTYTTTGIDTFASFQNARQAEAFRMRLLGDRQQQNDAPAPCYACQERVDEGLQELNDEAAVGQCRDCSGWFCKSDFAAHILYRTTAPETTICHRGAWDSMIGVHGWPAHVWEEEAQEALRDA